MTSDIYDVTEQKHKLFKVFIRAKELIENTRFKEEMRTGEPVKFYCPYMRALDEAIKSYDAAEPQKENYETRWSRPDRDTSFQTD